jgi:nicotinamidase-related amidase
MKTKNEIAIAATFESKDNLNLVKSSTVSEQAPGKTAISDDALNFDKETTALVVIDPYNNFISEGGKIWSCIKAVAEANNCVPHMKQVLDAARKAGIRVFYAPHRRYRPGDYESWKCIAPIQKAAWRSKAFEFGTWGGEIRDEFKPQPGEIIAQEHWCSSGFANTDLDLQLKKHRIHKLIIIGLIAHTCVEATIRYAAELGYEVMMVKDATADYSDEHMRAALEINIPHYASAIVPAGEIVNVLSSLEASNPVMGFMSENTEMGRAFGKATA